MTPEEFDEWLDHPVTKRFFAYLKETEEDAKIAWGNLLGAPVNGQLASLKIELEAIIKVIRDIPTISYEDIDGEHKRREAD